VTDATRLSSKVGERRWFVAADGFPDARYGDRARFVRVNVRDGSRARRDRALLPMR
jgi:hypothetical protein